MSTKFVLAAIAGVLLQGCGTRQLPLAGGTPGLLVLNGSTFADLQVNLFAERSHGLQRIAYGVTDADGVFSLITDDGKRPAILVPGRYHIIIESVAADPIPIPHRYQALATTPLVIAWGEGNTDLDIEIKESPSPQSSLAPQTRP